MKNILITGSTDGIGKATAIELARRGCSIIVHGRNAQRAEEASEEVARTSGSDSITSVAGDLGSLDEVRRMAVAIENRLERLDVLINNAGIAANRRTLTADGYESMFGINHLAPFLLTNLLLPLLKRSVPARVVNVASGAHARVRFSLEDLQMERGFDGWEAYGRSKLANVLFTYELARRIDGSGITANCLHPGIIETKLLRVNFSGGSSVEEGAGTSVHLALSDDLADVTGEYFDHERLSQSSALSHDVQLAEGLWRASAEMTGLEDGV